MKNLFIATILLLILTGACHSDDSIGPSDLLYIRWNIFQTRGLNESVWVVYDTDTYYDTEYRSDGTLIYRRNGIVTSGSCCVGNRFERNGVTIQYSEFLSCPSVKCGSTARATITALKDNLLELQTGDRVIQYMPVQ